MKSFYIKCIFIIYNCIRNFSDFHEQCIREWFARSRGFRCPGCRRVCSDQPEKNNIKDSPNLHKIKLCSIKSIPPSENV